MQENSKLGFLNIILLRYLLNQGYINTSKTRKIKIYYFKFNVAVSDPRIGYYSRLISRPLKHQLIHAEEL